MTQEPMRKELPTVPVVFHREGFFYVVHTYEGEDLAEHARLNPGTLRISDMDGKTLWPKNTGPKLAVNNG